MSRDTNVLKVNENYITQVSEKIKRRVTKKLFLVFSKTESCSLGVFSKLDEFLQNSQVRLLSGTTPGTSQFSDWKNQECNEDTSPNGFQPEVGTSVKKSSLSVE